jgi:DNA-binding NarL/FixJ family response regulator
VPYVTILDTDLRPVELAELVGRNPMTLKRLGWRVDSPHMDAAERKEILSRYADHRRRFEATAAKRQDRNAEVNAELVPYERLRELEPTKREIAVLQLISDGLVNREIGQRLFVSEETVKSHVRRLLAKLHAKSRTHAVAIGFRRGLIV